MPFARLGEMEDRASTYSSTGTVVVVAAEEDGATAQWVGLGGGGTPADNPEWMRLAEQYDCDGLLLLLLQTSVLSMGVGLEQPDDAAKPPNEYWFCGWSLGTNSTRTRQL